MSPSVRRVLLVAGAFFFRYRNLVFPLAMLVAIPFVARRTAAGPSAVSLALDALGIAAVIAGQALRALVIGLAYIGRGGKQGRIHADDLVQEGLFAHSRNPLYLGNLLILFGLLIVVGSPGVFLLGGLLGVFAYAAIIVAEEDFLRGKFGARYEEYCARVPRLFPRWKGLGTTIRSMRFDWQRLVRKEYGTTFAWVTLLVILLLLKNREPGAGVDLGAPGPRFLAGAWLAALVSWATARWMKKTGRLRSS